ncbi:MAG: hypothetical protein U9O20_02750 [Patescibacteria group bacterium]|nr:hypothetical protein [Patescibacteria group bacterium]
MEKDVSKKVIDKIKKEHIEPDPAWKTNLSSYVFWLWLSLLVFLSVMFLSLVIHNFAVLDGDILRQLHLGRFVGFVFMSAPYFWLVLFALCFVFGYLVFRRTKSGYRYSLVLVLAMFLFVIFSLGALAHYAKMGARLEREVSNKVPHLHKVAPLAKKRLSNPEKGVLGGEIRILNSSEIQLKSFVGENWTVHYSEKTVLRGTHELQKGIEVIIFGKNVEKRVFDADVIKATKANEKLRPRMEGRKPNSRQFRMKRRIEPEGKN